jgi:Amidohydrolase
MDLIAIALHKTNVYIDISGWSPKRIPAEVVRELKGRLSGQFVWGSDFPFIAPGRCLAELDELGLATPALLRDNAARILGLSQLGPSQLGLYGSWLKSGAARDVVARSMAVSRVSRARSARSLPTVSGAASSACRSGRSMIIAAPTT